MSDHVDWKAEFDHSWSGSDPTKVLRVSVTVGSETHFYDIGIAEASTVVEEDSTHRIESVVVDLADRFDETVTTPTGEVGDRFWGNVFSMCETWIRG